MLLVMGETIQADRQGLLNATIVKVKDTWLGNALSLSDQGTLHGLRIRRCWLKHRKLTEDLDTYDTGCDDVSNAKAVLMANFSNYGSDAISEVPYSESYHNDMDNQSVHAMHDFEQTPVVDFSNNEIHMDQSAQTVHLLTKPQVFYDNAHKQALGYQNPFYLKKAQRIKPSLYDGSVISSQHVDMLEIDDDETLILEEVSRSKMLAKPNDPISEEKKVNTTPINYVKVNKLSGDFGKRFVPQQELSVEQAFWFHMSNPTTESFDASPVKVEAPNELLKIRTTPDALTEGEWGFEHTKNVFINEIIPFLKSLKDIFNVFDKYLLNEITEVQTVFNQMEAAVQQCSVDKQCFEIVKKKLFLENDRLLQKIMSQDVLLSVMNTISLNGESVNMEMQRKYFENNDLKAQLQDKDTTICKLKEIIKSVRENNKEEKVNHDISELETINEELENSMEKLLSENERLCKEINHVKQVFKDQFDSIKQTRVRTKEQSDSLIVKLDLKSVENEDLKAQIQDKVFMITSLKNNLRKLKGKEIIENAAQIPTVTTIVPGMFKLDLDPLAPRLLQNREAHIDYLKHTQKQADILRGIVEQAKTKQPLDNALDFSYKHAKRIQELLVYVRDTCPNAIKLSAKNVVVAPINKVKKVRFSEPLTSSSNIKQCMLDAIHDMCVFNFVKNVNGHSKSAKKHKKQTIWKPTGHVFTEVGFKWKPTGRTFTLVGNSCPLTRFTPTKVVPIKESTSNSAETSKPELKVYSRRPKHLKNVGSSKKAKIVESKNANNSEPNHTWGSNATDIPSSLSPDLAKDGLARGIPKLKFQKDHLCSACALGKSKKSSHQPKAEDTNQEKLYLLHMDLCGLMHVESINGKKYILVIIDDYSLFTWVRFLRSKDEASDAIIKAQKYTRIVIECAQSVMFKLG
ncbi:retrovirus-related pol polyprotein from transposon TNT 1-94 [Tanacetum coccineum]